MKIKEQSIKMYWKQQNYAETLKRRKFSKQKPNFIS